MMQFSIKNVFLSQAIFFLATLQAHNAFEIFDTQIAFFSSGGFGRDGQNNLRGGYTNLFGKFGIKTQEFFGFDFGVGLSAVGLLHKVKNKDMYSDIVNNEIGVGFRINNDEAKDFRYTSTGFVFHTIYARYKNAWGSLIMGRFPIELEWIGDYAQGVSVLIDRFENLRIQAGWFDAQAYANTEENVNFGYINYWYNRYEGYRIKNNYFLDIKYHHQALDINLYYNYFDTLLYAIGIKTDWNFAYKDWDFGTRLQYVFVSASRQSAQYCQNPSLSQTAGLACYVPGSMGSTIGYFWEIRQAFNYKGLHFDVGYLQNDKGNATNNLPIYSDDNPLEYNTVIYGEGAKTGYANFKYEYKGRYFLGLKYGMSYYGYTGNKSLQGQLNVLGGIEFKQFGIALGYININDTSGYQNNIAKIRLGFKF